MKEATAPCKLISGQFHVLAAQIVQVTALHVAAGGVECRMGTFGMLLPEGVPKKKMKSIGWPHINRIVHRDGGRRRQDTTFTGVRARASQDMPGRCRESGSEGHCSSMDTERNAPVVRFLDECFLHPAFFPPGAFELKLEVLFRISFGVETTFKTDDTKISTSSHEIRSIAFSYPTR